MWWLIITVTCYWIGWFVELIDLNVDCMLWWMLLWLNVYLFIYLIYLCYHPIVYCNYLNFILIICTLNKDVKPMNFKYLHQRKNSMFRFTIWTIKMILGSKLSLPYLKVFKIKFWNIGKFPKKWILKLWNIFINQISKTMKFN